MYHKLLYLLIPVLLLNSCKYELTGTNYRNITISEPDVNFTILNEDELNFLRGEVTISWTFKLGGEEMRGFTAYLDDALIYSDNSYDGSFIFDTHDYPDSIYTLTFQVMTTTSTGSLASLAGYESYIFTRQYQVQIFNAPVTPPQITAMFLQDGALHIKWEKYTGPGFQKYVILDNFCIIDSLGDRDSTELIDPAFIGGNAGRLLYTYIGNKPVVSDMQYFQWPLSELLSATANDQDEIELTWEKNELYTAFSYYKLYRGYDSIKAIYDINTTTFTDDNPLFGGEGRYGFKVVPVAGEQYYPFAGEITAPIIGEPFHYDIGAFFDYIPAKNKYFVFNGGAVYAYDENLNITASDQIPTSFWGSGSNAADMSSDGELFYILTDLSGGVSKINPVTLLVENTYNLDEIAGREIGNTSAIRISDNNIMLVLTDQYGTGIVNYVFDFNDEKLIAYKTESNQNFNNNADISRNGKYIRSQEYLYKLVDTSLVIIGNVPDNSLFLEDSESLVGYTDNKLQILDCSTLSLKKEMTFENNLYTVSLDVDKADGYIGCESYDTGYYYVLDMENVTIKKKIPVSGHSYTFTNMGIFGHNRAMYVNF